MPDDLKAEMFGVASASVFAIGLVFFSAWLSMSPVTFATWQPWAVLFSIVLSAILGCAALWLRSKNRRREDWTKSFAAFSTCLNEMMEVVNAYLPNYDGPIRQATGLDGWQELFSRVAWPEGLENGAPVSTWPKRRALALTEEWALNCAKFARLNGGKDFNAQRIELHRIVESWVSWKGDSDFERECEPLVHEHRVPLVMYAYLEIAEAVRLGSGQSPGPWTKLPSHWPILRSTTAAIPQVVL